MSWRQKRSTAVRPGMRITAEVIAIDVDNGVARLSMTATENPELWTFLKPLRHGEIMSGTIAAIERFGVFVALDEGPEHHLPQHRASSPSPNCRGCTSKQPPTSCRSSSTVTCKFLQFDTWNGEARLSLRATQPDPFQAFADNAAVGQTLHGHVTKLVPFGAFAKVTSGMRRSGSTSRLDTTPTKPPRRSPDRRRGPGSRHRHATANDARSPSPDDKPLPAHP